MANALQRLTHNWQLKLTALLLAFLFWAALRREQPYRYTFRVPVQIVNEDPDWVLATDPDPGEVRVTLIGPVGQLLEATNDPPALHVPVEEVTDSSMLRTLDVAWVSYGELAAVRVAEIEPTTVRLSFERLGAKLLPITFDFTGRPADGFVLDGAPVVEPPVVRAGGGVRRLARLDSLRLPLNLDGRSGVDTLEIPIDTTGTGLILSPNRIRVILPLRPSTPPDSTLQGGG